MTNITLEILAAKMRQCTKKLQHYESIIQSKARAHDSHLSDIATAYRRIKTDFYAMQKEQQVVDAFEIDDDVIAGHVDKRVEALYIRAAEMLAVMCVEVKEALK